MIAVVYDNAQHEGQLAYSGGRMVDAGHDLETAALMSLLCHARALPGDVLPIGTNRRGYWADAFDADGDQLGSMLWLLETAVATPANAQRAEGYAQEALKWLLDERHVLAIDTESEVKSEQIWLKITFTLPSGAQVSLSPFKVN